MAMRIDDNFSASNDSRATRAGRAEESRQDSRIGDRRGDNATDSASLSALSLELSRALERVSPEETARIERLKEAVSNGSYDVPKAAVSARIVSAALEAEP